MSPKKTNIDSTVTIRFSGDSGDGMQLTGNQFTSNTAIFGNDLATLPDFPAEIRAPQGRGARRASAVRGVLRRDAVPADALRDLRGHAPGPRPRAVEA